VVRMIDFIGHLFFIVLCKSSSLFPLKVGHWRVTG
jgi:hypothetical protein